jgi:hypothetical protein
MLMQAKKNFKINIVDGNIDIRFGAVAWRLGIFAHAIPIEHLPHFCV